MSDTYEWIEARKRGPVDLALAVDSVGAIVAELQRTRLINAQVMANNAVLVKERDIARQEWADREGDVMRLSISCEDAERRAGALEAALRAHDEALREAIFELDECCTEMQGEHYNNPRFNEVLRLAREAYPDLGAADAKVVEIMRFFHEPA